MTWRTSPSSAATRVARSTINALPGSKNTGWAVSPARVGCRAAKAALKTGRLRASGRAAWSATSAPWWRASKNVCRTTAMTPMSEFGYASPGVTENATCCATSAFTTASFGEPSPSVTKALWPRTMPFDGTTLAAVKPIPRSPSSSFGSGANLAATRASGVTPASSCPGPALPGSCSCPATPKNRCPAAVNDVEPPGSSGPFETCAFVPNVR